MPVRGAPLVFQCSVSATERELRTKQLQCPATPRPPGDSSGLPPTDDEEDRLAHGT